MAKHFDSYDFSTLYTSIPHAALKEALEILIREQIVHHWWQIGFSYYEYNYMRNLIKMNLMLAKFINTMRYIDDLLTLNNTSFHSAIGDIYLDELKL